MQCIILRYAALKQPETADLICLSNCREICPFHGRRTYMGHLRGPNFGSTAIEANLLEILVPKRDSLTSLELKFATAVENFLAFVQFTLYVM